MRQWDQTHTKEEILNGLRRELRSQQLRRGWFRDDPETIEAYDQEEVRILERMAWVRDTLPDEGITVTLRVEEPIQMPYSELPEFIQRSVT